ncbi:GL20454 [Drosophila persimilis]|uniref:GL20454 n=1 Tax=Drosophila persimilis TaxID=7234 RepID=B4GRE6_DROPE|nr:GL20454 [Drosophila persimilis]
MCSLVAVSIHIGLLCPGSASIIHHAPKTTTYLCKTCIPVRHTYVHVHIFIYQS